MLVTPSPWLHMKYTSSFRALVITSVSTVGCVAGVQSHITNALIISLQCSSQCVVGLVCRVKPMLICTCIDGLKVVVYKAMTEAHATLSTSSPLIYLYAFIYLYASWYGSSHRLLLSCPCIRHWAVVGGQLVRTVFNMRSSVHCVGRTYAGHSVQGSSVCVCVCIARCD